MPLADRLPPRASRLTGEAASVPTDGGRGPTPPSIATFMLDVPFSMRGVAASGGARWDEKEKTFVYRGVTLPEALSPFRSPPYSLERLKEDLANGRGPVVSPPTRKIVLREHQEVAVREMVEAERLGRVGFLNADDVGLGKTIETWEAVLRTDAETVLVVCPLAAVATWRRTIAWMGDKGKRIVVINYDRLRKLFDVPANIPSKARRRKKTGRKVRTHKGVARYGTAQEFDVAIFDESHKLRIVTSARSKLASKLVDEAGFVLWLSATAGQNPLELAYLAPLLAEATGARVSDLAEYEKWCQAQGIGVVRGAFGKWNWRGDAEDEVDRAGSEEDLARLRAILFEGTGPAVGIRRTPDDIVGWPAVVRIANPVALEAEDRLLYEQAWSEFREALGLERTGAVDSRNALVARLRFRQKCSLLRTAHTVSLGLDLLEQGQQVAVSVFFRESLDVIRDAFVKEGYGVSEIHGRQDPGTKESQRLDFQHGRNTVCVYTVEEAINLHQGEHNEAPRSNLLHDLRYSAISMKQLEGRCHRDGRFARAYWMFGADTVEEQVAMVVARRLRSMSTMQGDHGTAREVEELFARLAA